MEFRVLGPLEVLDEGVQLPLGGPRQRLVLAHLLLDANRVVPTDRLIDRIWGDEPPDAARSALFAYISRLKKLLGAGRIQARPPGYILLAEPGEVDGLRFAAQIDDARTETDPRRRSAKLATALELWRGDPLSDLADHDALRPALARLQEMRLGALEDRAETQLALGEHREAVAAFEDLVSEHPLRERAWALLMLALYRSGRQGDALAAFHRARTTLVEELGIDPSPELRDLHEQILKQDPGLDRPASLISSEASTEDAAPGLSHPASTPAGRRPALISGAMLVILVAVAVGSWVSRPAAGILPAGPWKIAVIVPLSGGGARGDENFGKSIRDAVRLAIDDVNGTGGLADATLELVAYDRVVGDPRAIDDATQVAGDTRAIALIGPLASTDTFGTLPITNQAGLLECSPAATHPGLTKPRNGALDFRGARPDAINFIRLAPADDIQSVALASFAYRDLNARSALIVDVAAEWRVVADAFETEFARIGGTSIRRTLNPGAAPATVLEPLESLPAPDALFLAGDVGFGEQIRRAMAEADVLSTPLLSWDGLIYDSGAFPPGTGPGSYILDLGSTVAGNSFAAHGALPDHKFSFADAFRSRYGYEPIEYAAAAYACVEIVAAALRGIADERPVSEQLRERVRAYAVDPQHRYETVLGTVGFDANGDALQQFVSFYRVDLSAAGGVGSWVLMKKQDFGPAP